MNKIEQLCGELGGLRLEVANDPRSSWIEFQPNILRVFTALTQYSSCLAVLAVRQLAEGGDHITAAHLVGEYLTQVLLSDGGTTQAYVSIEGTAAEPQLCQSSDTGRFATRVVQRQDGVVEYDLSISRPEGRAFTFYGQVAQNGEWLPVGVDVGDVLFYERHVQAAEEYLRDLPGFGIAIATLRNLSIYIGEEEAIEA